MPIRLQLAALLLLSVTACDRGTVPERAQPKPNILVVSFCSVRQDHLSAYGYSRPTSPNLEKFARKAFVFDNAIGGLSWVNATSFVEAIPGSNFILNGYQLPGPWAEGKFLRVPRIKGLELDYRPGIDYLRQLLFMPDIRPFFLEVHVKYAHFPYHDFLNRDFDPTPFLSARSRELFKRYTERPAAFPDKLPMLVVLLRDREAILAHPLVKSWRQKAPKYFNPDEPWGVVHNEKLLEDWKKSAGYEDDLRMLQEVYDAKIRYMDSWLGDVLNLFGDPELQKNTIVVAVGDHGESFMEHGYLIHGDTVFDEALRFPLMVRFPGSALTEPRRIDRQFFMGSFASLVQGLVDGSLRESNFAAWANRASPEDDAIVSRNCSGTLRSLRYRNHWKLVYDLTTRERTLYDLQADPGETKNVISQHPDEAGKLEELLMKNFGRSEDRWDPTCTSLGVE